MATAQKFDTLDGLVVTGTLETGGLTSSGNLTVDTNTLFVNTNTNGVAIGNTSTYGKLYISHTGANPSLNTTSAQNAALTVHGSSSTIMSVGAMATGPYVNYIQVTALSQNNAYPLTLQPVGGNVGIGTSTLSPDDRLTVNGGAGTGISIWDSGASSDALRIVTNSSSSYINTITHGNTGLEFNNNSTSRGYKWSVNGTSAVEIASTRVTTFRANVSMAGNTLDMDLGNIDDVNTLYLASYVYHDGNTTSYFGFPANNQWKLTLAGSDIINATSSTTTVQTTLTAPKVQVSDYFIETKVAAQSGTGTKTFDLNTGSSFEYNGTGGSVTVAFSNVPTSDTIAWTLKTTNSGSITWPAAIRWAEGVDPPESAGHDIYSFMSIAGTIYGSLAIRNAY